MMSALPGAHPDSETEDDDTFWKQQQPAPGNKRRRLQKFNWREYEAGIGAAVLGKRLRTAPRRLNV